MRKPQNWLLRSKLYAVSIFLFFHASVYTLRFDAQVKEELEGEEKKTDASLRAIEEEKEVTTRMFN